MFLFLLGEEELGSFEESFAFVFELVFLFVFELVFLFGVYAFFISVGLWGCLSLAFGGINLLGVYFSG